MRLRSGAALAAVLFLMALTSALVVAGVYASRSLAASTRFHRTASAAEEPAERALMAIVAQWDSAGRANQAPGTEVSMPQTVIDSVTVASWITRLSAGTWWLVAETTPGTGTDFARRIGLLVHGSVSIVDAVPGAAWVQLP